LRAAKAKAAQLMQPKIKMHGNLEGDATGLRSFCIKRSNTLYADEVAQADKLASGPQKVYRIWVRLLGVAQRGGRIIVWPLPDKAVSLKAKPPPESEEEVRLSGLVENLKTNASVVFSDGAHSWPCNRKRLGLKGAQVCHQKHEHVRRLKKAPMAGLSKVAGTQSIDACWRILDDYMPRVLHAKVRDSTGTSRTNPTLWTYVWSWVLRHNMTDAQRNNLFVELGLAVKASRPS
jgi:hypothetical protein